MKIPVIDIGSSLAEAKKPKLEPMNHVVTKAAAREKP
jgi:hypothetical protein